MSKQMAGRLTTFRAAMVIARRDFAAVLFSRSFFFFLLGPLFPVLVAVAASSLGHKIEQNISQSRLGVAMEAADAEAMVAANQALEKRMGGAAPELVILQKLSGGQKADPERLLHEQNGAVAAVISGTPTAPVITGPQDQVTGWSGPVSLIAARASGKGPEAFPPITGKPIRVATGVDRQGQLHTAQAGLMLLFLLTMLLAGMVLSNLVEEKANKIIEVLAAAIPMDAVFYGKLFAMLAVSFVGITVWGLLFGGIAVAGGHSLSEFATPAVGWPMFIGIGIAYFAMAYLLLGSVFLTIGSMATTVREVQTLSMPVSMSQLMVFFFASYAAADPGSMLAKVAEVFPLSSPFAMLSHAAQDTALAPHLLALAWQALWVAVFVHFGSRLFRRRVMKSGPQRVKARKGKLKAA